MHWLVLEITLQALQIIDTTLLKCYLQTNDALVASLLRLKDNHCHLEEAERVLKKASKHTELVIFYNTKGLHRKALELLHKHAAKQDSVLHGHQRTVTYLQNLGAEHINLICEFSTWVIKSHPEDALLIFTEDVDTVESLPRSKVLDYLMQTSKELVIPYLEHLILVWLETNPLFHNTLILRYKEDLVARFSEKELLSCQDPIRRKLMNLLRKEPVSYTAHFILPQFPLDCLYEERAVLLGEAARHKEALAIYVHVLGDLKAALEYADRYQKNGTKVYQVSHVPS